MKSGNKAWYVLGGSTRPIGMWATVQRRLLERRGLSVAGTDRFFDPQYDRDIHDPFLLHDMEKAVDRISQAIKRCERIVVYGDYDVDGLASTALLVTLLRHAGAQVIPYLPHRYSEGYGLQRSVLEQLAPEFDLLITVDCGISNRSEVAWLKEHGKDVIIIDHHELPEVLPVADAVIHPRHPASQYPCPYLAAAGVTWKVCQAFLRSSSADGDAEKWLLDLAVLGTLSDMVPLVDENRLIVHWGLQVLRQTRRPGLTALLRKVRLNAMTIDVKSVSWRIIPQLNAAGKMDHAQPALDILLARSEEEAQPGIEAIAHLNNLRRLETTRVFEEAQKYVDPEAPFLFAAHTDWPAGVVGLVAGRLSEKFGRPAIVIGGNGRHAVGSARSPHTHNILELLRHGEEHFLKFGGHARAAGFSLMTDTISQLHQTLLANYHTSFAPRDQAGEAEAILHPRLISWETVHQLERFAPYGEGNREPVFIARRLPVVASRSVGKTQEHLKLHFNIGDRLVDGIGFGLARDFDLSAKLVDALFTLNTNEFRGQKHLQLELKDIAPAGDVVIESIDVRHAVH